MTRDLYASYDGLIFLLRKKAEAIATIEKVGGGKVKAIFSSGYPNYLIPEIDSPDSFTSLRRKDFAPVPEILQYVGKTLTSAREHHSQDVWPCSGCYASLDLQSLRPTNHDCISSVTPFFMFSSMPDTDLYIVVEDSADALDIVNRYTYAKLNVAENQIVNSVIRFPDTINIDPFFVTVDDLKKAFSEISTSPDDWFQTTIPTVHHHGGLAVGRMHLGLDFASQFVAHRIHDKELLKSFQSARNKFAMSQHSDRIVEQVKGTKDRPDLPRKTGRFIASFPDVEERFRARLARYREAGIGGSTPEKGYVVVKEPNDQALFELFDSVSSRDNPVLVIDENLIAFLGEFSPSFVAELNEAIGSNYHYNPDHIHTEKAVRLAMAHMAFDNILFEGNATPLLLKDRLSRLAEVVRYLGLPTRDIEMHMQELEGNGYDLAKVTYFAKQEAFKLYRIFAREANGTQTLASSLNEYPFVEGLKKLFGKNLENIILYGSSTKSRKGKDYDLLVIVDEISEQLYIDLENKQREINDLSDRDVQMIIVPKKDLSAYLSVAGMPFESIELIYGPAMDIATFQEDITQEVAYQANRVVRSLASMQLAFKNPDHYVRKPQVLRAHLKLTKYLIESYRTLYHHLLPDSFFDQLNTEFRVDITDEELTSDKVKALRSLTIYNLFAVAKRVQENLTKVN